MPMLEREESTQALVGIALGGGGLTGVIHIGILDVFHRHRVPIDVIAGSSIGGLIAGLYSVGHDPRELERLALNFKEGKYFDLSIEFNRIIRILISLLLSKLGATSKRMPRGLISGNDIEEFLVEDTEGKFFNQTEIPVAITATDVETGELIVFVNERLVPALQNLKDYIFVTDKQVAKAIRATISIPGLFEPCEINERLLVDGGVKDNVPADILDELGVDIKIAIDLGFSLQDDNSIMNPIDMVLQSFDIMGQEISNLKTESYADLVIKPQVSHISLTDTDKIPYLLKKGREIGYQLVPEVKRLIRGG
ncbi:NTE family protein [Candidatus Frackibacter sp. WG13]|nr:NTE family protein [Candidatus Frackibacter sp. WG13]